jgi:AcrR family transcriptional regulator
MRERVKSRMKAEMLDCAAGLFAQRGFEHTSLKQIADALNYTKAGLLYHFPTKQALFDAVLDAYRAEMVMRATSLTGIPAGAERDLALIEGSIDNLLRWPGMAEFGQQIAREGFAEDPRILIPLIEFLALVGIDFSSPDLDRMTRVFAALAGVNLTVRVAHSMKIDNAMRNHIIAVAMETLGHHARP